MTSFSTYQAPDLHECAKHFKIKGHSKLKKADLVALLNSNLKILKSGEVKRRGRGGTVEKPPLQKTIHSSPVKQPKKKPVPTEGGIAGGQLPLSIIDKMKDLHLCLGGMIGGDMPGLNMLDKQTAKQVDKQKYPDSKAPQIQSTNISFLGPSAEMTPTGQAANQFLNMLSKKGTNLILTGADKYLTKASKFDFVKDALTEAGIPEKTAEAVVNVINPYTVTKDVVTGVVNAWAYKYHLGKYKKSKSPTGDFDGLKQLEDGDKPTYSDADKTRITRENFNWDQIKDRPIPFDIMKTYKEKYGTCENALVSNTGISKDDKDAIEDKCPGTYPGYGKARIESTSVDNLPFDKQVDWYIDNYADPQFGGIQNLEALYQRRAGNPKYDNDAIEAAIAKISGQFDEERRLEQKYKDSQAASGGAIKDDEIDWEDIKWGSFTKQLEQYNSKLGKKMDLPQFAEMILKDPKKYKQKTVKRARFYKNVLQKK